MSLRSFSPKACLPTSHYFITFARGNRMRTITLRPAMLSVGGGLLAVLGMWSLVATLYLIFRDDMLAALLSGETQMQYAYEDRLASMRAQLDKVTSRQLLDQTSFEGKVHALASRQAQLESRARMIAQLSEGAHLATDGTADSVGGGRRQARNGVEAITALTQGPQAAGSSAGTGLTSYAPDSETIVTPAPGKPHPEDSGPSVGPTSDAGAAAAPGRASPILAAAASDLPVALRLGLVADSLDRIEAAQLDTLTTIGRTATATAAKVETALNEAGLSPGRFARPKPRGVRPALGGPFVPFQPDPHDTAFESRLRDLQEAVLTAERLKKVLVFLPMRRPLRTAAEITSGFGPRTDPFNGRVAMHTGIDFGQPYGAPVRTTAAGRVSIAGPEGGYGNLVEIEHGNGLSTRYGHLSAILVTQGQWLDAGAVVGEVGATGRATGPHLHYETRIDGEAVDPIRFLRAGQKLFAPM